MSVRKIFQRTDCCTVVRSDISSIPTEALRPIKTTIKSGLKNNDVKSRFMIFLLTTNYWGDQKWNWAVYVTYGGDVHVVFWFENDRSKAPGVGGRTFIWILRKQD